MNRRSMILQMCLVAEPGITLGMGTIDRLSIRMVPQVLPMEVSFEAIMIAESLFAVLKGQFRLS